MSSSNLIVFSYLTHDDERVVEVRSRTELTPQHVAGRLAGAVQGVRDGEAVPAITWGMMRALVDACGSHGLPIGPDAPRLLDELRSLCLAS
ncbi:hypothetical protein [Nonomuraea sp. NPDC049646]|uniref:hypothetical protein n=1 Tax=unclassified Nonomuraea TaxID=2593643 RepID=UPI0037AFE8DA